MVCSYWENSQIIIIINQYRLRIRITQIYYDLHASTKRCKLIKLTETAIPAQRIHLHCTAEVNRNSSGRGFTQRPRPFKVVWLVLACTCMYLVSRATLLPTPSISDGLDQLSRGIISGASSFDTRSLLHFARTYQLLQGAGTGTLWELYSEFKFYG